MKTTTYQCLHCGAGKTVINDPARNGNEHVEPPESVPCGWRGCTHYAIRIDLR